MHSMLSSLLVAIFILSRAFSSPITTSSITALSRPTFSTPDLRIRAEPNTSDNDLNPDEEPHPNKLDKLESAFNDAFELASYAISVIDDSSRAGIFTKYFNEADRANVRKVFDTICTNCNNPNTPAEDRGSPFLGEIMNNAPNDVALVLCQRAFNKKGVTVINGQDANQPGSDNNYIKCDELGDNVSFRMNSLGMTLLHEYTHYNRMTQSIFNAPIIDQEDAAGNPIGYGPVQVRSLDKNLAKLNADSYAYFASEALWSVLCQKDYGDAVPGQDDNDPDCNNAPCKP